MYNEEMMRTPWISLTVCLLAASTLAGSVHTTYLWHMHQPVYWPDASLWSPGSYQAAYESIYWRWNEGNQYPGSSGSHPFNDLESIFGSDDRVADYQYYPRNCLAAIGDIPDSGAQVSFAASLIENIASLADAGWSGGRYPPGWSGGYREAALWSTTGGHPRLDLIGVGAHHAVNALIDPGALRMEIRVQQAARQWLWPDIPATRGFFPAETCFSERMVPVLVQEGYDWVLVPNIHISRACSDYPFEAMGDNIDPPNPADQINGPGEDYFELTISRGITTRNAVPMAFRPHQIQYVDPYSGLVFQMTAVPTAQGMSWNEGYGSYGFDEIAQIAGGSTPSEPLLVVFAHDGDNAYSGGYSYFNENVPSFCHQAQSIGHHPTTVEQFLTSYPASDLVHVEDGGWVNADGDFGSPQFINWNWPLVGAGGQFDIPGGWAEDERNWAVITAAHAWIETAEQIAGPARPHQVFRPQDGASGLEKAWHFYLASLESGYMYYGASIDMEVKATLACNQALGYARPLVGTGEQDQTGPAIWLPQRLPWNPGGMGMGSLWNWSYTPHDPEFYVWTFVHDPSDVVRASLYVREDADGFNPLTNHANETYAGGAGVGPWAILPMNRRDMPLDDPSGNPEIDLFVLPEEIATEYWVEVAGYEGVLLDYFVEAEDGRGNLKRSPIQHVYVGDGQGSASGIEWEPRHPTLLDTIRITAHQPGQGGSLHWGVNAEGHNWESPDPAYWPMGSSLWQDTGPALESPFQGPDPDGDYWVDLGPFNDPAQEVHSVDFVIHWQDESWDNNGGSDYHITISQHTPTPTPSGFPTNTPTPTRTPTPTNTVGPGTPTYTPAPPTVTPTLTPTNTVGPDTPTPAPWPGEVAIDLLLNSDWFGPGDQLILQRTLESHVAHDLRLTQWIALEAYGHYYFHPTWTEQPDHLPLNLGPYGVLQGQVLAVPLPGELAPAGPFYFHAILTDRDGGEILSPLDTVVFGFY